MSPTFSHLVTRFFTSYLARERGLSQNTIASYSDSMRLLIGYACKRLCLEPEQLTTESFSRDLILDFLDFLEVDRRNSQASRNQRLAAIKSFFHFLARVLPECMHINELIQAIRPKNATHSPPPSLTVDEVQAIIAQPAAGDLLGTRDKALLQILYNSGARVQEIADLKLSDLCMQEPASVSLTGKGNKTRVVPLWSETVQLIRDYLQFRENQGIVDDHLFLNNKGQPMTRFGIGKRVDLHAGAAAKHCPSLRDRNITPHVFRHTAALHLIESGNDITVVGDWLGHADLKTTSQYIEISLERKRKALDKLPPPGGVRTEAPKWRERSIMDFLRRLAMQPRYVANKASPSRTPGIDQSVFAT